MIHTPPGLDIVCYSNGYDYVRGMRYAMRQAKAGRIVMTVDSTALLNERHVSDERKLHCACIVLPLCLHCVKKLLHGSLLTSVLFLAFLAFSRLCI